MIRLAVPDIGDEEIAAATRVLRSGMLVQGAEVARFEALCAERCARRHAVAVANGTTALDLALAVLGVGAGDEVLVPDLTWPSPAHAVLRAGATPVLVDVDAHEWNAMPAAFAAARTPRTRAAIAIDQFGNPARVPEIVRALDGIAVIEDAACAIGSLRSDGPCGSGSVLATLSFHPRKVVTTGEGGMVLTDDDAIAERLRELRNHGQRAPGDFVVAGGNQRLSEVAAALGATQMERLDALLASRRRIAARYRESLPLLTFQRAPDGALPNAQTVGALSPEHAGRDGVVEGLKARGVEVGKLSYALHTLASLPGHGDVGSYPNTTALVERGLALPAYATMDEATQEKVIAAVREVLA